MENRTMPYFGLRTGFGASTTLPFQRPRGLGRGYRPSHSMSHPPFIGNGATRRDSTEYLRDLHERDRLSKALHKLSASLGDDQFARLHKEVIAETEKLSRSAAKLALKMTNRRDQIFNGANTDRCPKEQSTFQDRGRYISATDTRRVSRNNTFGKAITIPMFWGETVVLHISWETCWVPMKLLEKIFNCPGVLLGAFSGCFRHSSVTSPDNSVCFDCLLTLRMRFHHFLSNETRPILDNLQHILERNFKHRNGYVLHKSSPLCMYRNTSPL